MKKQEHVRLVEAGSNHCRWIVRESPPMVCGKPTSGNSWCFEHRARVFSQASLRKDYAELAK